MSLLILNMIFRIKFSNNQKSAIVENPPSKSNVPRVLKAKVVIVMSSSEKLKWEEPVKLSDTYEIEDFEQIHDL